MPYLYTGTGTRSYMDYVDTATDRMLVAEPGWQGEMRVTDSRFPVPPADGYWEVTEPVTMAEAPLPEPTPADSPRGAGKQKPAPAL